MTANIICHICNSPKVTTFAEFAELGQATSDCKPWPKGGILAICNDCGIVQKGITDSWRKVTAQIYSEYDLYHQSPNNQEQPIFNSLTGTATPRSIAILDFVGKNLEIEEFDKIIDIGCGVGNTLKSIVKVLPKAKLYGFEPNAHKKEALEQITNIQNIFTKVEEFSSLKFDMVTMVHVLEHIENPLAVLKSLQNNLQADNGHLVIAVPDYVNNPFDLIITDHASHFSVDTLSSLLIRAGFEIVAISNQAINKEIIAICKVSKDPNPKYVASEPNTAYVKKQLQWMVQAAKEAEQICQKHRPFGIFGTSIAANWLYGMVSDKVDYFVDEDQDRVNRLYHAKPVYHPNSIPRTSHTYVCLQPNVTKKVMERIKNPDYTLHGTPEFS